MGTHAAFLLIETVEDSDGTIHQMPLCAVLRTCDGEQALEAVLKVCDVAEIANGAYAGMPANVFNGSGRFALRVIDTITAGWEDSTMLIPVQSLVDDDGQLTGTYEIELAVYIPYVDGMSDETKRVGHSLYSLEV